MAEDLYQHNEAATKILNQSQEVMDFDLFETMFTDQEQN